MNFGWVNIYSQFLFSNAAFLLSISHVLFLFPVYAWHSTSKCLTDYISRFQGHSGESNPGTFLEGKNLLRLIFPVLIWTIRMLAALQSLLCILSVFFIGFGQTAYSSLSVFSLFQTSSNCLKVFYSYDSLMVAFARPTSCFSDVCPKSYSLHSSFFLFDLLHPLASLATISASILAFMFLWAGIHWRWINIPLALKSSISYAIVCIICSAEQLLGLSRACIAALLSLKIWIPKLWFWHRA